MSVDVLVPTVALTTFVLIYWADALNARVFMSSHVTQRLVAGAWALAFSLYLIALALMTFRDGPNWLLAGGAVFVMVLAILCGWYAIAGGRASARARISSVVRPARLGACIGLAIGALGGGVVGQSAQGPLVGLLTGPAGFLIGVAIGAIRTVSRQPSNRATAATPWWADIHR